MSSSFRARVVENLEDLAVIVRLASGAANLRWRGANVTGGKMSIPNPTTGEIADLLRQARTIAVIGLSDNPHRPSYEVAAALQDYGYSIIPVNPRLAVWEGMRAVPHLDHIGEVLGPGENVDIVDVFRRPQHVSAIVDDCIRLRIPTLWLQLGVVDEVAAQRAADSGIRVIMDRCIKIERMRLE
jgi:predicted CoA-binding protein